MLCHGTWTNTGANQIQCLDADSSGFCDGAEVVWQYDATGNLLNDGAHTYTYDAANRLVSVSDGVTTTSYTYNGDGDRIAQTVDGVTTTYVIDTATDLTMVLSETTNGETITYLHGLGLVAQSDGVTTEYFLQDGLGSVRQLADGAGAVVLSQIFDPYGNPYLSAGAEASSYGYAGEQTDANGLVFLRARYYNPAMGRFLNTDPSRQEKNPYLYAYGNPLYHTDPSGLSPCANNTLQDCACYMERDYNLYKLCQEGAVPACSPEADPPLPPPESDPNRNLAVVWAQFMATATDPEIERKKLYQPDKYPGVDCAVLVSTALNLAGFPMSENKESYEDGWWAHWEGSSAAWQSVDHFYDYWTNPALGGGSPIGENQFDQQKGSLLPGDVLLYQTDDDKEWDHIVMVVDVVNGIPYVASRVTVVHGKNKDGNALMPYDQYYTPVFARAKYRAIRMPFYKLAHPPEGAG